MPVLEMSAVIVLVVTTIAHVFTSFLVIWRCRWWQAEPERMPDVPVSILRPVRGVDEYDELTLRSSFTLAHPKYELIFSCADAGDAAVRLVKKLIREHPAADARLLIGDERSTANPKLNNVIRSWAEARYDWVVLADSNVLMPADYLSRLFSRWGADTGLVCSPPLGSRPKGIWAEVECAFLNTYQARWQIAADTVGLGFAQGKSMLWWRADLDELGGVRALGGEIAEDAAATKIVRRKGKRVRLVDRPFEQPLGHRTARQVWDRQLRWAKLRRATFPAFFAPELLSGCMVPVVAATIAAPALELSTLTLVVPVAATFYGCEALMARALGWHLAPLSPLAWLARDLILPVLWVGAWFGRTFTWRGNEMNIGDAFAGDAARRAAV